MTRWSVTPFRGALQYELHPLAMPHAERSISECLACDFAFRHVAEALSCEPEMVLCLDDNQLNVIEVRAVDARRKSEGDR